MMNFKFMYALKSYSFILKKIRFLHMYITELSYFCHKNFNFLESVEEKKFVSIKLCVI